MGDRTINDYIWSAIVSHNGEYIATGGADKIVRLWNSNTGEVL